MTTSEYVKRATRPQRAWDWRRASGGISPSGEYETFHAHDVNDLAACAPSIGLVASRDEPNEGSRFCEECMAIVKSTPEGRPLRSVADAGSR